MVRAFHAKVLTPDHVVPNLMNEDIWVCIRSKGQKRGIRVVITIYTSPT